MSRAITVPAVANLPASRYLVIHSALAEADLDVEGDHFPFEDGIDLEFASKMVDK
jgi:hypothetical protein